MASCPACGKELPGEFPFCPFCAAPLDDGAAAPQREERKVVSVLFCDLVGFTAASEAVDPEDVRARIRPYHSRLRQEIERYGGTVEKFVGDAVMAVFGAPVAHEDDAERAVRAGLRILEAIDELNAGDPGLSLQVRIGINTGEAVVALDARPAEGEAIVTGDVVNTASRLQGAAPVDAIAVSEQTYRATERVFDYEQLEPVRVKGKAEPLAIWRPLGARARFGSDLTRDHAAPLIGRELEKPLLIGTFERSAQQRSCQLVTLVGEPGVGKSRLCAELFEYVDERRELVTWRQGRCLPYGDGIAFWALGEIVKAECGILDSDSPEQAAAKLERALPADDPDLPWLRARLQPLLGAGGEPASQDESFTAWRRFLESLSTEGPTVLVFEDLHWADEALLAFLEHVADWVQDLPLLLLCTARPELYERHPTFGANARNAQRINLAPLSEAETARLIAALLERAVLPAETQQALLERAGGNPLFAEEFVRLLADRGEETETDEVPDSVQALIAARLDTLAPERKSLLQDASVLGKVFWAGALAEMGELDAREVELALHELGRKELVRAARTSSMEGESEYGFWHLLVRDVCYAQIPRAARAARHEAAAAWIEQRAGERAEDLADLLAHHYLQALAYARVSGRAHDSAELETRAVVNLALAGERALPLDVDRAERNFSQALEIAPADYADRGSLLESWAQAARQQGRVECQVALEEALALYRARGDNLSAGRVLVELASLLRIQGDLRSEEMLAEAMSLLEAEPAGAELVAAYGQLAGARFVVGAYPESMAAAEHALALAAELGLPEPAPALGYRAGARSSLGEREGVEDMRRALELAIEQGLQRQAGVLYNNLAIAMWEYEGPQAALEICREGIEFCERRGMAALGIRSEMPTFLADAGQTEQALAEAGPMAEQLSAAGVVNFVEPWSLRLRLLAERGQPGSMGDSDELLRRARESGELQMLVEAITGAARALLAQGSAHEARALLVELGHVPALGDDPYFVSLLPELVRTSLVLGEKELGDRLAARVGTRRPLADHALRAARAQLAEAEGDPAGAITLYAGAAERWREFGNVPERAYALLGQGRCLARLGRAEAEAPLREAHELFASMGYQLALAETEELLAAVPAA